MNFDFNKVINFWFHEIRPEKRWKKDLTFDNLLKEQFLSLHTTAVKGELFQWREEPKGRLAEIIIIDQFSRNIFRDLPQAFLYDSSALFLAQEAVSTDIDPELTTEE